MTNAWVRPSSGMERGCNVQASRRTVLAAASALGINAAVNAAVAPATAEPADERPKEGDYLVAIDATDPLFPKDVAGSPVIAWPMEPAAKLVRNGSRLNKVLLVRLDP